MLDVIFLALGAAFLGVCVLYTYRLRSPLKDQVMTFDYLLGGGVTVFLLAYLVFALIRPERF